MPIPEAAADGACPQYGIDSHASDIHAVLGSVVTHAAMKDGTTAAVTYLVRKGSSQWVVGKNVTNYGNVRNIKEHCIIVLEDGGTQHHLSNVEHDMHQYPHLTLLCRNTDHPSHTTATDHVAANRIRAFTATGTRSELSDAVDNGVCPRLAKYLLQPLPAELKMAS